MLEDISFKNVTLAISITLVISWLTFALPIDLSIAQQTPSPQQGAPGNWTGSIVSFPIVSSAIQSNLKVSLIDATQAALDSVGGNSSATDSTLTTERGFLVYLVSILDDQINLHRVVVDAGTGEVLDDVTIPTTVSTSPGTIQ